MEIKLDQCVLRAWRKGDETSLVRHANDRDVSRDLRDRFPFPYTMNDAVAWIDLAAYRTPQSDFAIDVEGEAVGGIGVIPGTDVHRRSAEIGYWLGKQYWGRGIVTQAARSVTDYAFQTFDVCRIHANVFDRNIGSQRVLEKVGYELEARHRQAVTKGSTTLDELVYARLRP